MMKAHSTLPAESGDFATGASPLLLKQLLLEPFGRADAAHPRGFHVLVVDAIPGTSVGKPDKRALRDQCARLMAA